MLRAASGAVVFLAFLAAMLFGSAGEMAWPGAWLALGVYAALTLAAFRLFDPGLLQERSRIAPGFMLWDLILSSIMFVWAFPATLLVAGLDHRRHWSASLPLAVQVGAFGLFAIGLSFSFWAEVTNKFFAPFVRIQTERSHHVITGGPYAYVRHPGYAGFMLGHAALPFLLGSLWALVPTVIGFSLLVVRAALEDRTLHRELVGYREYAERVRWRLLPGVW